MKFQDSLKLILVLLLLGAGVYFFLGKNIPAAKRTISLPSPTPQVPRVQKFFISSKVDPRFTEVLFDPYLIRFGEKQTVSMKVNNAVPIESVYVVLNTDHRKQAYDLKLIEGTNTKGTWSASWKFPNDTNKRIYSFTFYAVAPNNTSTIDFSFGKEFPKSFER